jgi:hypothetical protein
MHSSEENELRKSVLRLNERVSGIAVGILLGLTLFVATNWLVLKGGPHVGAHLALLRQYFPGYSVSFVGSLIGFVEAFVVGYVVGALIVWIYNAVARPV